MNHHFVREKRIDITQLANGLTIATERMPEIATATSACGSEPARVTRRPRSTACRT